MPDRCPPQRLELERLRLREPHAAGRSPGLQAASDDAGPIAFPRSRAVALRSTLTCLPLRGQRRNCSSNCDRTVMRSHRLPVSPHRVSAVIDRAAPRSSTRTRATPATAQRRHEAAQCAATRVELVPTSISHRQRCSELEGESGLDASCVKRSSPDDRSSVSRRTTSISSPSSPTSQRDLDAAGSTPRSPRHSVASPPTGRRRSRSFRRSRGTGS